ncbi:potassium channel protein [Arcobacter sp. 15-2]|uniref:potassium channel family protein n=1 Tax=Arcobacter sp. 15-2 TaxID=3374109 RepID=UPI00399CF3FA
MINIRDIKKALGWEYKVTKPEFSLDKEIYSQFKHFRLPLILLQLIMIIGTMGYMIIDDFTLLDALFQTGITFTTVGFGEVKEISQPGRLFTITLIIFGFLIFTLSITTVIQVLARGKFLDLYKERNMLYKIARLRNHFVIFNHNEYSIQLAEQFKRNHIPFIIVDPRDDIEQIAHKYNYPYFIKEETYTEKAFLKTHLSSAKGVISLSKNISDSITIIASVRLYEKELGRKNPYLIICNAESQKDIERLKKLGANKVVAPPELMAKRVSAMAIRPDMENVLEEFLYKKDTPIDMEEIYIKDDSWFIDQEIKDAHLRDKLKVSIIGITEANGNFLQTPKSSTKVRKGCKLLVVGNQAGIARAKLLVNDTIRPDYIDSMNKKDKFYV